MLAAPPPGEVSVRRPEGEVGDAPSHNGTGEGARRRVHEMSIAQEVYRTSRAVVAEHGGGRLRRVAVAVGELTAVEPELLRFAWAALTGTGADAGAALEVDFRPARQRCTSCGVAPERAAGSWLRICHSCGGPLAVDGGDELDLLRVEFDGNGAEDGGRDG